MEFPDDSLMNKTNDAMQTSVGEIVPNNGDNKESGGSGAVSETLSVDNNKMAPPVIQASLDDSVVSGSSGRASKGGPAMPGGKKKKKKKKKANAMLEEQALIKEMKN